MPRLLSILTLLTAAPAFAEIAQFALEYLEIPPDLTKDAISDRMAIPGERNRPDSRTSGQSSSQPE